jgi:uncharacterized membrane protein
LDRVLKPVVCLLAVIYFLVDAAFMPIARQVSAWVAGRWVLQRLRTWIVSLRPYPTLFLFAIPVAVLEPIKPVSLYLIGIGYIAAGLTALIVGELLKLVIIERLFCLCRHKLMAIPAFAWAYGKYRQARDWVVSSEAWQNVHRWSRVIRCTVRRYSRTLRSPRNPRRLLPQPR